MSGLSIETIRKIDFMFIAVVATFILGYIAIVFEHPLKLDKKLS